MLKETILEDLKTAMKAKDVEIRDTLRMLDSMVKNEEIAAGSREEGMDDDGVMALIKRAIKQRTDSAQQYRDGGREELAAKEDVEIAVLSKYLPEQMSAEDVKAIVEKVIADTGATSKADMGKVMGPAMQAVGDAADGNTVRAAVDELLV